MNRKLIFIILFISLLFTSNYVFADKDEYLKGHWAEKLVDKQFINKHFDYLSNEETSFEPDNNITKEQFMISLYSLLKEAYPSLHDWNNIEFLDFFKEKEIVLNDENLKEDILFRKDAVKFVIKSLESIEQLEIKTSENKYIDLQELSQEYITYILKASNLGIVNGYLDNTFKPNKSINQIEAIIILKRLERELNMYKNTIPFNVISSDKAYNLKGETINVQELEDKIIINITKEFSTSGYSMNIDKIVKQSEGNYSIYLNINKPNPNSITLQVITYQTLTIEIDKKYLDDGEYKFTLILVDSPLETISKQKNI